MSSLRVVLLRSSLVFALCLGATACGPSTQEAQTANVKPGSMPEGGDWPASTTASSTVTCTSWRTARAANGAWRTTAGDAYGEMSGEIDGDLFRYSWTERRIGAVGADANRKGKGYFRYTAPKAGEAHVITGEWGLGDSDAGNPWEAVKQKNMPPNPDSVQPGRDRRPRHWRRRLGRGRRHRRRRQGWRFGRRYQAPDRRPQRRSPREVKRDRQCLPKPPGASNSRNFRSSSAARPAAPAPRWRRSTCPRSTPALPSVRSARRSPAGLPEVSEPEAIRHFVRLSQWNFSIDTQFYPLGSCTMKHNPKVNEWAARLAGFAGLHPLTPDRPGPGRARADGPARGAARARSSAWTASSCSPRPARRASSPGLMMIRAYHQAQGRSPRKVFIPDSAHGTNPASCALNGFEAVRFPAGPRGVVEPETLSRALDAAGGDVAALMITNPNTLGLYEQRHARARRRWCTTRGGLVYGDGANMNAVLGPRSPGRRRRRRHAVQPAQDLHHAARRRRSRLGPGRLQAHARAVPAAAGGASARATATRSTTHRPHSVGRVRAFYGNFGMMVRAYTYIREMGAEGLRAVSDLAVLNANYLAARLDDRCRSAYDTPLLHEVVFTDRELEAKTGVKTLDVAKRLIDYGFHPPTVYFPLVVRGALMIEPTETETKQTLDEFVAAMLAILREAEETPELVKTRPAPHAPRPARRGARRAQAAPALDPRSSRNPLALAGSLAHSEKIANRFQDPLLLVLHAPAPRIGVQVLPRALELDPPLRQDRRNLLRQLGSPRHDLAKVVLVHAQALHVVARDHRRFARRARHQRHLPEEARRFQHRHVALDAVALGDQHLDLTLHQHVQPVRGRSLSRHHLPRDERRKLRRLRQSIELLTR